MPCKIHILFYIKNSQGNIFKYKNYINYLNYVINLGNKNGPVGWNGLAKFTGQRIRERDRQKKEGKNNFYWQRHNKV